MNHITRFLESHPVVGYLGAGSGFAAGLLSFLEVVTKVGGVVAMGFGVAAGYYTWRIQRRNWYRIQRSRRP